MESNKCIPYNNPDKHFFAPKKLTPFYASIRIPRKLKKIVKKYCGSHYNSLDNGQRMWYYLEASNQNYKRFLIKKVCEKYGN